MTELLHDRFRAQAATRSEQVALVWKGERTTYGELDDSSDRLARLLVDAGCGPGDRVALLMPKSPAAINALLAALKASCAYVPLDPAEAPWRLARLLQTIECRCLLAAGPVAGVLEQALAAMPRNRAPAVGALDEVFAGSGVRAAFTPQDVLTAAPLADTVRGPAESLAQILFTSGSTGDPKGVMIAHSGAARFISWAIDYFGVNRTDRVSQHPPMRFDVSTFDIFSALSVGAELHLVPPELNVLPHKLAQFIRESQLTQWFSVPSTLNLLAKFGAIMDNDFPALRRLLFAGEVLPTPTLIHLMRRLPHVQFTNLYGPTETTIASSYYTVPECPSDEREPIPIGRACGGEELLVLDAERRPVPAGTVGDLYIRGAGVSPGYWGDSARTREAFVASARGGRGGRMYRTGDLAHRDADGVHYYHGRMDTQIKSRGYRIELGEIEAALHTLPTLSESAVVAIESTGFEGWTLCCAYVPAPDAEASVVALRKALATRLPSHMLPTRWQRYDSLPKNASGKCDRRTLKDDFRNAAPLGPSLVGALRTSSDQTTRGAAGGI